MGTPRNRVSPLVGPNPERPVGADPWTIWNQLLLANESDRDESAVHSCRLRCERDCVAEVSEITATASVALLNSSLSVAGSVSGLAVAAMENSLALGDTFWRGVDMLQVTATRCDGQLVLTSAAILEEWLNISSSKLDADCQIPSFAPKFRHSVSVVSTSTPFHQIEQQHLNENADLFRQSCP